MALIETLSGDFEAVVTTTEPLMQPATITFTVETDLPQALDGSLNEWMPLVVHIPDGGDATIDIPSWVTKPQGDGIQARLEARDASIWLWQIGRDNPWTGAPVVNELLASNTDNVEARAPSGVLLTGSSLWQGDMGIITGATPNPPYRAGAVSRIPGPCYMQAIPGTSPTTADGLITFTWPAYHASGSSVYQVRVNLQCDLFRFTHLSWPAAAPNWTLTLGVSWDGGVTWGPNHVYTVDYGDFAWGIDVTADHAWALTDLTKAGNVQVRLSVAASNSPGGGALGQRFITGAQLVVVYGATYGHTMPLLPGAIDPNAPAGSLAVGHKMLNEWFTDLVEQTGYEWAIHPTTRLGWATLDWQKSVGGVFSTTVTIDGVDVPLAGIEQGQLAQQPKTLVDGMAAITRVYAYAINTTTGAQTSAVADDTAAQAKIGIHEKILKGNSSDTSAILQASANSTLLAYQQSQVSFTVLVPRIPGLWSALRVGATLFFRGLRMPYAAWEGTVRIVQRDIDEGAGMMTLTLLPLAQTSPAVPGSGFSVAPARTTQQAKFPPGKMARRNLVQVLQSYWHPRRV